MSQIADSSFSGDNITYSFLFTAILVLLHLAAPYIRRTPWLARKGFTSFSGGFAVAYVFLHMLPGLVESKDAIGEILHFYFVGVHFVEISVFLLAFLGFIFFFGLKRRGCLSCQFNLRSLKNALSILCPAHFGMCTNIIL